MYFPLARFAYKIMVCKSKLFSTNVSPLPLPLPERTLMNHLAYYNGGWRHRHFKLHGRTRNRVSDLQQSEAASRPRKFELTATINHRPTSPSAVALAKMNVMSVVFEGG